MRSSLRYLTPLLGGLAQLAFLAAPAASEVKANLNGAALYGKNCASCHGAEGKGDGPLAGTTKRPVADLTTLAERHGGVFPRERVLTQLADPHTLRLSGMPRFALRFRDLGADKSRTQMIYRRLADYIETLQKEAPEQEPKAEPKEEPKEE